MADIRMEDFGIELTFLVDPEFMLLVTDGGRIKMPSDKWMCEAIKEKLRSTKLNDRE